EVREVQDSFRRGSGGGDQGRSLPMRGQIRKPLLALQKEPGPVCPGCQPSFYPAHLKLTFWILSCRPTQVLSRGTFARPDLFRSPVDMVANGGAVSGSMALDPGLHEIQHIAGAPVVAAG